jgi:hypothetical protein
VHVVRGVLANVKSGDHGAEAGAGHADDGAHLEQLGVIALGEEQARHDAQPARPPGAAAAAADAAVGRAAEVRGRGRAVVLALVVEERPEHERVAADRRRQADHRPEQAEREVRTLEPAQARAQITDQIL